MAIEHAVALPTLLPRRRILCLSIEHAAALPTLHPLVLLVTSTSSVVSFSYYYVRSAPMEQFRRSMHRLRLLLLSLPLVSVVREPIE